MNLVATTPTVRAHAEQIEQALLNLVTNAVHAMPQGGSIVISTNDVEVRLDERRETSELAEGRYVAIRVADTGVGMDEKTRARAFDPFFTTKVAGSGSGLGLAMVQGMAHRAGGHAALESEPGRGTTVTIFLPRASGYFRTPSERPPVSDPLPAELVVVAVSDDAKARAAVRDYFRLIGCHASEAAGGFEALDVLKANRDKLVVLLVDAALPNLARPEFASAARASVPSVRVAITPLFGAPDGELDGESAASRSHLAGLYDAVVRALTGTPSRSQP